MMTNTVAITLLRIKGQEKNPHPMMTKRLRAHSDPFCEGAGRAGRACEAKEVRRARLDRPTGSRPLPALAGPGGRLDASGYRSDPDRPCPLDARWAAAGRSHQLR